MIVPGEKKTEDAPAEKTVSFKEVTFLTLSLLLYQTDLTISL